MSSTARSDTGPRFVHDALASRVVFGAGRARTSLAEEVDQLGGQRVMVIATGHERALAGELVAGLGERIVTTFDGVRPHVPIEVAEAARAQADAAEVDLLLSVGGGSTTGTAKAIALTSGRPILAIPTTYAGSEVTPVWGLTEHGNKTTGRDPVVLPRTVIYDAELTLTLPAELSAASGLNALAHAVEAFWAPGRTPISSAFAETAIRALASGLPGVVDDGSDVAARGEMLLGAWLAGAAFATAGSGLHHKICHVLGGMYDLPHAETHAIVLPHVLAFNAPHAADAAARIATALDVPGAVTGLVELARRVGAPGGLHEVGVREEQLDAVIDPVVATVPEDNPRRVDREAIAALLHRAWAGPPPIDTLDG